ncbi:serine hydrolase [bacterium SCSIO 12643]|nr:serine hydrolase [bacterium SCSIO 12643]
MKVFSKVLAVLIIVLLAGFIYFISNFGPIISGFGAKGVCSCVFVGNRTAESAIANELGAFPLSLGHFEVNMEDSSATGTVFGLARSKAIYRKGLGCTLIRERSEEEIRTELPGVDLKKPELSDTLDWPLGTRLPDSISSHVDLNALKKVIAQSFENTNPEVPAKTRGVLVVYDGQLVLEEYADEFDKNSAQLGWSMTKSVTNGLYGIMVKKGMLDIYQPAPVSEWQNADDPRSEITTDELLRMSSGLYWEEVYSNVSTATNMLYKYARMGDFAVSQDLQYEIGSKWYYSSGTTNILSKILREQVGEEKYYQFAQNELFSKLGVTTAVIEPDAGGTHVGSSYMWASARDWARLGLLYLNNGNWYGEQILPENWVNYTVQPTAHTDKGQYGAQWWLNAGEEGNEQNRLLPDVSTDMYMMDGYEGQRVFVVPSKKLVVVRLGQNKRGGFDHNWFLSSVMNCIK